MRLNTIGMWGGSLAFEWSCVNHAPALGGERNTSQECILPTLDRITCQRAHYIKWGRRLLSLPPSSGPSAGVRSGRKHVHARTRTTHTPALSFRCVFESSCRLKENNGPWVGRGWVGIGAAPERGEGSWRSGQTRTVDNIGRGVRCTNGIKRIGKVTKIA